MLSNLARIFLADLIVRGFYQIGKTPLLPIFAASIGASELVIGFIISVSTLTGIALKPIFGILSDRWGKKLWLIIAAIVFSGTPFLYGFIDTETELIFLRLFHGVSTAIFGPVSLAYVAMGNSKNVGGRIAYFGMSRLLASLMAPLLGGLLLTFLSFEEVFLIIGSCSLLAMIPIFLLDENESKPLEAHLSIRNQFQMSLSYSIQMPAIWLAGFLELMLYMTIYAVKAFLPLFILLQEGGTVMHAGLFFFIQELTHFTLRPYGGKLFDKNVQSKAIIFGVIFIALSLCLLSNLPENLLLISAVFLGVGQGLVLPSSVALLFRGSHKKFVGAAMGFYGALRNVGKVLGPIVAGTLLISFNYSTVFYIFAGLIILFLILSLPFWIKTEVIERKAVR